MTSKPIVCALIALLWTAPAAAEDAEADRLEEEIRHLAKRNTWGGVERAFADLEERGAEPTYETWIYASQAARQRGDMLETHRRLQGAEALQASQDVSDQLRSIDQTFGRVVVLGAVAKPAVLEPAVAPFAEDQRRSIEVANNQLDDQGFYRGMLPSGKYGFGGADREVHVGDRWTLLTSSGARTIDSPSKPMAWGGGSVQWQGESLDFAEVRPLVVTNDQARGALGTSTVLSAIGWTSIASGAAIIGMGVVRELGPPRFDPLCEHRRVVKGPPPRCEIPKSPVPLIIGGVLGAGGVPLLVVGGGGKRKAISRYNDGL